MRVGLVKRSGNLIPEKFVVDVETLEKTICTTSKFKLFVSHQLESRHSTMLLAIESKKL